MERILTPAVLKTLAWVFLIFWPVIAMLVLLQVHFDGHGTIIGGWDMIPLIVFATVFFVYYPGIMIYGSMALMHTNILTPRPYRMSKTVRALFIIPAAFMALFTLLVYIGALGREAAPVQAVFSNNGFLAVMFIYYPVLTLYEIFHSLVYRMRYFFSVLP